MAYIIICTGIFLCLAAQLDPHTAIGRFQQYLYKVRPQVQDEDPTRPMTHHGLRHP